MGVAMAARPIRFPVTEGQGAGDLQPDGDREQVGAACDGLPTRHVLRSESSCRLAQLVQATQAHENDPLAHTVGID